MKLRKLVSVMLTGALILSIAGCGSSASDETTAETSSTGTEVSVSEEESETITEAPVFDEQQEITMYSMTFFGNEGCEEVEEAINEISIPAINVKVNYEPLDVATYIQQTGLMMAGGEEVDLVLCTPVPAISFSTMYSQGELMDISDILPEYAPDLYEKMEKYIGATTINGSIYGVPVNRCFAASEYIAMRKDILDELGLTEQAENISSWSEFEEILAAVQAGMDTLPEEMQVNALMGNFDSEGNVINLTSFDAAADAFADDYGYDVLGDLNKIIYVDDSGVVQNYFGTEDYKTTIERVHSWYEKGYIYKDASTSEDTGTTLMANNVIFATMSSGEYGAEHTLEATTGKDVVYVKVTDIPIQTSNGNTWSWGVSSTAQNPEAAVAFLNLMYTNADVQNLFTYGIEGRDYELNEEGEAVVLDDKVYQSDDWSFGDQFLSYPAEGNGSDMREKAKEQTENAEISPYYGCVVDTQEVANEITAVSSVLSKYKPGLESGTSDPSTLDAMLSEMEASGLQEILDCYQSQLDAWLAEQN